MAHAKTIKKTNPDTDTVRVQRLRARMGRGWRESLPPGDWFPCQKKLFTHCEALAKQHGGSLPRGGLLVAWDRQKTKKDDTKTTVKAYWYYQTHTAYFSAVLACGDGRANGYELIPENTAVNLYMDIEWLGAEDREHEELAKIKKLIDRKVNAERQDNPQDLQCLVMYSSRKIESKTGTDSAKPFKNSYHLICNGVVFPNNHDGEMKRFVEDLNMPHRIDTTVYTRNRVMRTLGCSKFGSDVVFMLMTKDGLVKCADASAVWRDTLVTVVPIADCVFMPSAKEAPPTKKSKSSKSSKDGKGPKAGAAADAGADTPAADTAVPDLDAPAMNSSRIASLPYNLTSNFVSNATVVKQDVVKVLPQAVQLQLEKKAIVLEDLICLYLENPKQCAAAFIKQHKSHTHQGNNAIATIVTYKDGRSSDVYVKCLCDCKWGLRALYTSKNYATRELPKMSAAARAVLETPYGIDGAEDAADRRLVKHMYGVDVNSREQCLRTYTRELMWKRIWPYNEWCFIANPKKRLESMMLAGHKRAAGAEPESEPEAKGVCVSTDATAHKLCIPVGRIVKWLGTKAYFAQCPLCPAGGESVRYTDADMLRNGPLRKICRVVPAHEYELRFSHNPL